MRHLWLYADLSLPEPGGSMTYQPELRSIPLTFLDCNQRWWESEMTMVDGSPRYSCQYWSWCYPGCMLVERAKEQAARAATLKTLDKEITALSNQIGALRNLEPEFGSENEIEIRVLSRWKLRLQESLRQRAGEQHG